MRVLQFRKYKSPFVKRGTQGDLQYSLSARVGTAGMNYRR
jgi:hypothetical protein